MSDTLPSSETTPAARSGVRDRLRFDVLITSGAGLAVYALALITGPLLARTLGPAGRGDLAAVIVPTQVLGFILLFGLPHAAAYYATKGTRSGWSRTPGSSPAWSRCRSCWR